MHALRVSLLVAALLILYLVVQQLEPPLKSVNFYDSLRSEGVVALQTVDSVAESHINLSDLQQQYLIVSFWASWCQACISEKPLLKELQKKLPKASGRILGIAVQDTKAQLQAFLAKNPALYPTVMDSNGILSESFAIRSIPQTMVVAPDGSIVWHHSGVLRSQHLKILLDRVQP